MEKPGRRGQGLGRGPLLTVNAGASGGLVAPSKETLASTIPVSAKPSGGSHGFLRLLGVTLAGLGLERRQVRLDFRL